MDEPSRMVNAKSGTNGIGIDSDMQAKTQPFVPVEMP